MSSGALTGDSGISVKPEAVLRELDIILASTSFVHSPQLTKFLRYTVEQTLRGNADRLKEYQVGIDVFDRSAGYDTRTDPVVRVQARQLRFKLADYYAGAGVADDVVISLPKGGYLSHFELRKADEQQPEHVTEAKTTEPTEKGSVSLVESPNRSRFRWTLALAFVFLVAAGTLLFAYRHRQPAVDPEAKDLYLRGRYYWNKRTAEDLNRSIDLYTQAVVKDPSFAEAYVGLADAYNLLSEFGTMSYREAFSRALAAARRAVQLDQGSAEAHSGLAFAAFYGAFDPRLADREFRLALRLNPNYATAHHWYATFLLTTGRSAEALVQINEAQSLEPASDSTLADKDLILAANGRSDEAIVLLKQLEASEPNFSSPHAYLANLYMNRRQYPDYLSELRQLGTVTHDPELAAVASAGKNGYAQSGERGMLQAMLQTERAQQASGHLHFYSMASLCALLGDADQAIDYLQRSLQEREPAILAIAVDPTLKSLRGDRRFQKMTAALAG